VTGTNLEYAKSHNRRAVIEAVRRVGAASRAEIARETALTGQTISNIVAELEAGGLLIAGETRRGARGQPSLLYRLNPQGAWSLGFHLDHRSIRGALVDLTGATVALADRPAHQPSPDDAVATLPGLAGDLIASAGVAPERILGAGLALPVRFGVGPITTAGPTTLPGWDDPTASARISKALALPVLVENDGAAAAIRERLAGVAQQIDSFVCLFVDDGMGAGIFLGGQPWRGASRNAGEIGHMIIEPGGLRCPCGNLGCLERYVSLRAAYEAVFDDPDGGSPERLEALAERDDPGLRAWATAAARYLARAVNMIESALDPETILIGGPTPRRVLEWLVEAVDPLPVSVGSRLDRAYPRLMLGGTGPDLAALGAASLPVFDEINPRFDLLFKR
jgi:predicted NBD/HSP70 family sugar kinase